MPEHKQELIVQKKIAQHSLRYLEDRYSEGWPQNEHLTNLYARLKTDLKFFDQEFEGTNNTKDSTLRSFQQIYLELLDRQRGLLREMNHRAEFNEELIRKYLSFIDLEELKIREKLIQE